MAQQPTTVVPSTDSRSDSGVESPSDDLELFTVAEVAERLRVKPWSVYNLCKTGALPSVYIGPKSRRIKADDLRSYIESLPSDRPTSDKGSSAR